MMFGTVLEIICHCTNQYTATSLRRINTGGRQGLVIFLPLAEIPAEIHKAVPEMEFK